jgi:hypothetical protein
VSTYLKHLRLVTVGMLLAWRNIPGILADAWPELTALCWSLVQIVRALTMPLFFWASPLITYFYSKEIKKYEAQMKGWEE